MVKSVVTGAEIDEDSPFAGVFSGAGFTSEIQAATMTPEQRQEQYAVEAMQAFTEKVSSEEGLDEEDYLMAARSFIDGLWFNKSEEVGSAITAAAVSVLNPELVKGKDFSQVREEILASMEADSANFQEDNPWLAIGTNVAGGILNPVSLAGGQMIAQAYNLRKGAEAVRAADEVAMTLGQAPRSADAARLAAQYGSQQASQGIGIAPNALGKVAQTLGAAKVPMPVPVAGLMAAEGAAFGYEGDTTAEKAKNAAITAGISAAVPFAWAGGKQTYDAVSKSRLAQEIGEGADFVSLMFTEHGLAPVYRHVVSKAYGGFGLMEQQARKIAGLALTPITAKTAGEKMMRESGEKVSRANAALKVKSQAALNDVLFGIDQEIDRLKVLAKESVGAERSKHKESIALLEQAKLDEKALKAYAVKDGDAAVSAAEASFRGRAFQEAVPPGVTGKEVAELGSLPPQDANLKLDSLWATHGFKAADNYEYTVDPASTIKFLDNLAKGFPELTLVGSEKGGIIAQARQYVKQVLPKEGEVISGPELLQIRSDIGRAINGLSDNAPSARAFASKLQDHFHDILESKMSSSDKARFAADRAAWGVRAMLDETIAKSSTTAAKAGAFTPDDWLSTVKMFGGRFAARGQGRLQKEAERVAKAGEQNNKNIIELANQEARTIAQDAQNAVKAQLKQLETSKIQIGKDLARDIAELNAKKVKTKANSAERLRIDKLIAERKAKSNMDLQNIADMKQRALDETNAIKALMPSNFDASVFERLFSTSILGQVLSPAEQGISTTLAAGTGVANVLARESTQRMLAGQTGWQRSMQAAKSGLLGDVAKTTAKGAAGVAPVAAQATSPSGLTIPKEDQKKIMSSPKAVKAGVYRSLERSGRLEKVKQESPEFYRALKAAI